MKLLAIKIKFYLLTLLDTKAFLASLRLFVPVHFFIIYDLNLFIFLLNSIHLVYALSSAFHFIISVLVSAFV